MLTVQLKVEAILKFQGATPKDVFFDMQEASFEVEIPKETAADLFEDVAIEAIDESKFFTLKPSNGKDADVIGVAVTRVLSIG